MWCMEHASNPWTFKRAVLLRIHDSTGWNGRHCSLVPPAGAVSQLDAVFTKERKARLLQALVDRYLPLSESDIANMLENPEEFHQDSSVASWEDALRPCAEALVSGGHGGGDGEGETLSGETPLACAEG